MFKDLEGQSEQILASCIELSYFMRGSIQYRDFMDITPLERKLIGSFLEKRMEVEGKRVHPVY
jgi:hypothetical protein